MYRGKSNSDVAVVGFFLGIAAIALVFVIPFGTRQTNTAHNVQHGTALLTIPTGQSDASLDVFFLKPFATMPRLMISFNETTYSVPFLSTGIDGIIPVTAPGTVNTWAAMPAA